MSIKIQSFYNEPFGISELMFNRGAPREYVKSPDDVYYYAKSEILQLSDEIDLKVNKDGIISQINMSPEEIKILANKLKLEGVTTINEKVVIDMEGKLQGDEA